MFCGQCGKKVMENMLFCPFCGSPIVIPEQDVPADDSAVTELELAVEAAEESAVEEASAAAMEEELQPEGPISLFADEAPMPKMECKAEKEDFVPLSFDFAEQLKQNEAMRRLEEAEEKEHRQDVQDEEIHLHPDVVDEIFDVPARRSAPKTRRHEAGSRRPANTFIPVKEIDPGDMFMDDFGNDEEDEYDLDDTPVRSRYREADFDFEEPEHGNFFQRHIRGIVGLILLLMMLVICAAWAFSPKGQEALAKVNLAWEPEAYADLGYEAYHQDSDLLAARYYEKALSRDESNYEYAHSAMVAYYEAHEIESAAAMLKKCVELAPDNPEPYQEMLILYPDAESRPWEISELIRLGYQRTGHEALNIR